jgi:hypothetical protein
MKARFLIRKSLSLPHNGGGGPGDGAKLDPKSIPMAA